MKALLYCTKGKPNLWQERDESNSKLNNFLISDIFGKKENFLNGKIVAEVEIDKVEEIKLDRLDLLEEICKKSCLSHSELYEYLADFHIESNCMFYKKGYALYLTNLKLFDRPNELSEWVDKEDKLLTNAPQNMCYCYHWVWGKYILISIQPQHLCKILNGEKTIEVRRKVLNCLKEMC